MKIDEKTKEQTDYLFNQIEIYMDEKMSLKEWNEVKRIIYKCLKVFNQGR